MTLDFREPMREPGAARFRWLTHPIGDSYLKASDAERRRAARQGRVYREVRELLRVTLCEVAEVHGVTPYEVAQLERGQRCFPVADDLWAALSQLWLMRREEL